MRLLLAAMMLQALLSAPAVGAASDQQRADASTFEWEQTSSGEQSGVLPMTTVVHQFKRYLVERTSSEDGRGVYKVTLVRHWGSFSYSVAGTQAQSTETFDSDRPQGHVHDLMSTNIGKPVAVSVNSDGQIVRPGASDDALLEAGEFLTRLLGAESTVLRLRTLIGAIELECARSNAKRKNDTMLRSCSTGAVQEHVSESEPRSPVIDMLVQALGPPRLTKATVQGTATFMEEAGLPDRVEFKTDVRYVLGEGSAQEVVSRDTTVDTIVRVSK